MAKVEKIDNIEPPKNWGFNNETLLYVTMKFLSSSGPMRIVNGVVAGLVAILFIAQYFFLKNKREEEAFKKGIKDKVDQANFQLQINLSEALRASLDARWQYRYDFIATSLIENRVSAIYKMVSPGLKIEVRSITTNEVLAVEYKAKRIIELMQEDSK